jgi:predicted PurR-regulated permease PerM
MTEIRPEEFPAEHRAASGRRIAGVAAALGLLALAVWMLATFLPALAWSVVLAIATWPVFVPLRERTGPTWAAVIMTVLIAVVILAPLTYAAIEAGREYGTVVRWIGELRRHELAVPEWIANLPMIGATVAEWLDSRLRGEQSPFSGIDVSAATEWGRIIGGQAVRRIATLFFALLIVFFVFRESDSLLRQMQAAGHRLLGPSAQRFLEVAAAAVRGTVDGLLLVGIAEAVLLGIAYKLTGVPHPALLGVVTGVFSVVPAAGVYRRRTVARLPVRDHSRDHPRRDRLGRGVRGRSLRAAAPDRRLDPAAVRMGAARHPRRRRDLRAARAAARAGAARGADRALARDRRA